MIKIQNQTIIEATKNDILYMISELQAIRFNEGAKDQKNTEMQESGIDSRAVGYQIWIKNYKPYRSMVDSLIKTMDSLNRMCNHQALQQQSEFMNYVVDKLNYEVGELQNLKEKCKGEYEQYRCLNDAYISLTNKMYKIELDMPRKVESEKVSADIVVKTITEGLKQLGFRDSIISKNKELGLIKYQQNVVEFKEQNLICDWPRNAGKTFTIAKIIELNKPKNILYIDSIGSDYNGLSALCDKFTEINKLNEYAGRETGIEIKIKTSHVLKLQVYNQEHSSEVRVYTLSGLEKGEAYKDMVFDYIFFAECLPYNVGVKYKQSISFITYNDKDEWLERFYPNSKVFKIDYRSLVAVGLLPHKIIDSSKESNYKKYLNEYAILD